MFLKPEIYLGLCAVFTAGHIALADEIAAPRVQGYSSVAPSSTYHASSGANVEHQIISPSECANVLDLAGENNSPAADLPPSIGVDNNYRRAIPDISFDVAVPLSRRRSLPPVAIIGEFNIDLKNGTTRLQRPGQPGDRHGFRC